MRIGDLVEAVPEAQEGRWLACAFDRDIQMVTLFRPLVVDGGVVDWHTTLQVPDESPVKVLANIQDWPFLISSAKPRAGRLVRITNGMKTCRVFQDWVVPSPSGGSSIFFNPAAGIRHGDVLVAHYERGSIRLTVPASFASMKQRIAKVTPPPPQQPKTGYARLLLEEED